MKETEVEQHVTVEVEGGVGWIRLNRPEKMNAIGALTRHREVETSDVLERECGVLRAVAAQVGSDDVETLRPVLLREPQEALAVTGHAVQADERRRAGIAPLVHVQLHCVSSPLPDGS